MSTVPTFTPEKGKEIAIGRAEVNKESLANFLVAVMNSMGLSNPTAPVNSTSKAIIVTKKGNAYVITLNQYDPPITFTWTGMMPTEKLEEVILKLVEENKKISFLNKVKTSEGDKFQIGIS